MSSVLSLPSCVDVVITSVKNALEDERVEVREKAGGILGGLLHCEFMSEAMTNELKVCVLNYFFNSMLYLVLGRQKDRWLISVLA